MRTEVVTLVLKYLIALTLLSVCNGGIFRADNFLCNMNTVEAIRTSSGPWICFLAIGCALKTGILLNSTLATEHFPYHLLAVLKLNF